MFFVGIFCVLPEEKKLGSLEVDNYPGYAYGAKADLYRNASVFEFFFIPFFRFNKRYYLKFSDSSFLYLLDKEVAERALREGSSINFYDLQAADVSDKACSQCGKPVEEGYLFCPWCGKER